MLHKWSRYCRPNISLHLKKQTDCPVGIHLHNWDCQFSMSSPDKHIYSIWLQQSFPCEKYKSGHTEVLLQSWYINSVEVRHLREGLRKKFGKKYGLLPNRGGGSEGVWQLTKLFPNLFSETFPKWKLRILRWKQNVPNSRHWQWFAGWSRGKRWTWT